MTIMFESLCLRNYGLNPRHRNWLLCAFQSGVILAVSSTATNIPTPVGRMMLRSLFLDVECRSYHGYNSVTPRRGSYSVDAIRVVSPDTTTHHR